ncbi:MAG: hypothetical protein RDU41_05965 [Clostridia bacterium]|nr:hypothetical protein [Clostridia bacterium]
MTKTATITYLLSEAGRKASILAGGDGQEKQAMETPVTPELLELAYVQQDGSVYLNIATETYTKSSIQEIKVENRSTAPGWSWEQKYVVQHFDAPQTAGALIAWEKARRERVEAATTHPANLAEIARLEAEYARREAERNERDAKRTAEAKAKEDAAKAKRERLDAEKAVWIEANGSDHLQRAFKLGYDCQRLYVTERAAVELPDFTVDFDDHAVWKSRSCPGEDALEIVEKLIADGHEARCVWLTYPPYKLTEPDYYNPEPPEEYEHREAVVIERYLGKCNLVLDEI